VTDIAEGETPGAPTVRVLLIVGCGDELLFRHERGSDETARHDFPSAALGAGQTIVECALALAGELGVGPLESAQCQGFVCVPGDEGSAQSVVIGVHATVAPASASEDARAPGAGLSFFRRDSLPTSLAPTAERALDAWGRRREPAIDLDGTALAIGFGFDLRARTDQPQATPDALLDLPMDVGAPPPSPASRVLVTALLAAGGGCWAVGFAVALHVALKPKDDPALAVMFIGVGIAIVASIRGGFEGAWSTTPVRRVGQVIGALILGSIFSGLFAGVANALASRDADDAHIAFWVWFIGAVATALGVAVVRKPGPIHVRRVKVLAAVAVVSFCVVFQPLREALAKSFGTDSHGDRTTRVEPPDDD
jgi:hypothetical protein